MTWFDTCWNSVGSGVAALQRVWTNCSAAYQSKVDSMFRAHPADHIRCAYCYQITNTL